MLEKLRELSCASTKARTDFCIAIEEDMISASSSFKDAFSSLPEAGKVEVYPHFVEWWFREYLVFTCQHFPDFSGYWIENADHEKIKFSSMEEMIESVRLRVLVAISAALVLDKVLPPEKGFFVDGIHIGRQLPGHSVHCRVGEGQSGLETERSIEYAVGPVKVRCQRGYRDLAEGEVMVLLKSDQWEGEKLAPYIFSSEEEALNFLSETLESLADPKEFDAVCKEE